MSEPELDAAGLAVLIARLTGIAEEVGAVLMRGAFSPNIKERADCSAALFTADGTLLVQAEHIPVHLGSMPASVRAAIDAVGPDLDPGTQVIVNDPFAGGTHLNDVTLVAPCHTPDGRLVAWVANRAHHADLGGAAPGSLPADAVEIQQEGLRLPPVRFTPEVRELVVAASRTPEERRGDIDAQVGANVVGVDRLAGLVVRLAAEHPAGGTAPGGTGYEGAVGMLDEVVAYGERRMRAAIAALPDGEWRASDVLDSFGAAPDQRDPTGVTVAVRVAGDRITFDFTGSDPQRRGNVNAVEAVTVSAAVFALRTAVDPSVPANGGGLRAVEVMAPPGSVVAARFPAAVGAGNVEVSQRVADVCLAALAGAAPDRVGAASQGTMNNVLIGGDGWVYYETVGGGQGGRPGRQGTSGVHVVRADADQVDRRSEEPRPGLSAPHTGMTDTGRDPRSSAGVPGQSAIHTGMTNTDQVDYRSAEPRPGQSGIHTAMTNTRNTPIEALERAFPLRVLRYRLRRGSGGVGWAPGGEGIERDLQVLDDATVSLITERRVSQPWGLAGGEPGAVGENWFLPGGDEARAERLPDKCTIQLKAGDILRMLTPGGGGWGPPVAP